MDSFVKAGIEFETLKKIEKHYESERSKFEHIASKMMEDIMRFDGVHSVRYRVKSTESLMKKILKRCAEGAKINENSYIAELKDTIGLRALHVFRSDWERIYDSLKGYETFGTAEIRVRPGDDLNCYKKIIERDKLKGVVEDSIYRSVHYYVRKDGCLVEIQARTLFDEAWSEIDHDTRYKGNSPSQTVESLSSSINRLAGVCDEQAELIKNTINGTDGTAGGIYERLITGK